MPPISRLGRQITQAIGAVLDAPAQIEPDPYAALDDLMAAVEALCPVWPAREPFADGGAMRL